MTLRASDPFVIDCVLHYPHIYQPHSFDGRAPRFSVCFHDQHGIRHRASNGYPPVVVADAGNLTRAFEHAEIHNIPRDRLFAGVRAQIKVRTFYYEQSKGSEFEQASFLGVETIAVNAMDLVNRAEEIVSDARTIQPSLADRFPEHV